MYYNLRGAFGHEIFRRVGIQPNSQQFFSTFARSFIHKSFSQNHCYEKSEFVGDSAVNFIIKNYLSQRYITCSIDELNQLYMILISRQYFSLFADKLGLSKFMLNKKAELSMSHKTQLQKDQCDVFESFCLGVMQLYGFDKLQSFVVSVIEDFVDFKELIDKFMIHEHVVTNLDLRTQHGKKPFSEIFKVLQFRIDDDVVQKLNSEDEESEPDANDDDKKDRKNGKQDAVTFCFVLKDLQTKQMFLQMCYASKVGLKRMFYGKIYELMKKAQFCYEELVVHLGSEKVDLPNEDSATEKKSRSKVKTSPQ